VKLLLRINLWLCVAFLVFTASSAVLLRTVLHANARADSVNEARLLLAAAQAARDYTLAEIKPALAQAIARGTTQENRKAPKSLDEPETFYAQTIPAYAANQILASVREKVPAYSYREAALNPTNPRDRAVAWEADVIQYFRANADATELINEREAELGRSLYLARPIRIENAGCLVCHSTAAAAPPAMLQKYGSANGFGWQLHEAIGAQIVSVPLEAALAGADRYVGMLVGAMTGLFALTFLVVNLIVRQLILKRIEALARVAQDISTGQPAQAEIDTSGQDEISALSRSFERMQTSVRKSLALLEREVG